MGWSTVLLVEESIEGGHFMKEPLHTLHAALFTTQHSGLMDFSVVCSTPQAIEWLCFFKTA